MNAYDRQLSAEEIRSKAHREFVGGMWSELGTLQLEFMKSQGLRSHHRLVDIGCGALRGGVHFVRYLEPEHYFGIDGNASLVAAGTQELQEHGLEKNRPRLLVNDRFEMTRFNACFEFGIAQSLFTHLTMNAIVRCLVETRRVLAPGGMLFATYFEAPAAAYLAPLIHPPANVVSHYDADPFHHSLDDLGAMATLAGMAVKRIGDWNHPRGQKMAAFTAK